MVDAGDELVFLFTIMVSLRLQWLLAVQVLIALSSLDLLVSSVEATPRHFSRGLTLQETNGRGDSRPAAIASKSHVEITLKEVQFTTEQLSSSEDFRTYRPRLRSESDTARERSLLAKSGAVKATVKKRQPPKSAPPPPKISRRIVAIPPPPPKNIGRTVITSPPPSLPPPLPPRASYSLGRRNL